jgi:hypothetical protein
MAGPIPAISERQRRPLSGDTECDPACVIDLRNLILSIIAAHGLP